MEEEAQAKAEYVKFLWSYASKMKDYPWHHASFDAALQRDEPCNSIHFVVFKRDRFTINLLAAHTTTAFCENHNLCIAL